MSQLNAKGKCSGKDDLGDQFGQRFLTDIYGRYRTEGELDEAFNDSRKSAVQRSR